MGRTRKKPIDLVDAAGSVMEDLPTNENLPLIDPELRATVEKYSHIDCVWMDGEGNWSFCMKPGFTAYSREDILNG